MKKMVTELMCDDKKAPTCKDKSTPKLSEDDEEKAPACDDGAKPVCTGDAAPKDKKEIMKMMMCDDRKAPKCKDGSTPTKPDKEEELNREADEMMKQRPQPTCTDGNKPVCTGDVEPELPEMFMMMRKMGEQKKKQVEDIDKAKFFCKDGKQPKCAAGKKLVWKMGGKMKPQKKFDPKKGGCRDAQKPKCPGGEEVACADKSTGKRCTNGQPKLCTDKREPVCGDGKPQVRPRPPGGKKEKLVCPDAKAPKCGDASTPACSDGSKSKKFDCDVFWGCTDGSREVCTDGSFPRIKHVKDKEAVGWKRPVRRPKFKKEDFTEDIDDELATKTLEASDRVADLLVEHEKTMNAQAHSLKT